MLDSKSDKLSFRWFIRFILKVSVNCYTSLLINKLAYDLCVLKLNMKEKKHSLYVILKFSIKRLRWTINKHP